MKNNFIKALLLVLNLTILGLSQSTRAAPGGGQSGSGAAGTELNGVPVTFFSASIFVEPHEFQANELFGLKQTIEFFERAEINPDVQARFLSALLPVTREGVANKYRRYHVPFQNHITETDLGRIEAEYRRNKRIPKETPIKLFAVTDTTSHRTLVLPDFFGIQRLTEAMAIWFHEAWWILYPTSTYEQVVAAEQIFQAYLEDLSNPDKAYKFVSLIGRASTLLTYSVNSDLNSKRITRQGILSESGRSLQLTLRNLLGPEYISCITSPGVPFHKVLSHDMEVCRSRITLQAQVLKTKFPTSNFVRYWSERAAKGETNVNVLIRNYKSHAFPSSQDPFYDSKCYFKREVIHSLQPFIQCYPGDENFGPKEIPSLIFWLN